MTDVDVYGPFVQSLAGTAALLWLGAYALSAARGFRDRTYSFPFSAICLNLSWELIFSFIYPDPNPYRWLISASWLILDIVLFYQLLIFGRKEWREKGLKPFHAWLVSATLAMAFAGQLLFVQYYGDRTGAESATMINAWMSLQFVTLFYRRKKDLRGLSYGAAWLKMLGSGLTAFSVHYAYPTAMPDRPHYLFLSYLELLVFVSDALYIYLLRRRRAELGKTSWV